MPKAKQSTKAQIAAWSLPLAPWVYLIHDPKSTDHAEVAIALANLIPQSEIYYQAGTAAPNILKVISSTSYKDTIPIINETHQNCPGGAPTTATHFREAAIAHGCNFVSVNITDPVLLKKESCWGSNHLDLKPESTPSDTAEKIYEWLYQILTTAESLHLIPDSEMQGTDTNTFSDYEYCTIANCKNRPKDAKIQFVAIITSKPTVANNKLHWTVADKSGVANFYFHWRGPQSKYTWDWVLNLQPGECRALPRMPSVLVKEKKRVTVARAPFRAVGFLFSGTGTVIKAVGQGLADFGKVASMGKRSEWLPAADVTMDTKGRHVKTDRSPEAGSRQKERAGETQIKSSNEKCGRLWKGDEDDDASTEAGSLCDEKIGTKFC